jgi:NADH-quinone oxidoreductase subunit B
MLIDAILKLHDKVLAEPLGDRRRKAIAARVEREGAPVVAAGAMPSSYRFNPERRKQWEQAAAIGREEQLRIENWMKARNGGVLPSTTMEHA